MPQMPRAGQCWRRRIRPPKGRAAAISSSWVRMSHGTGESFSAHYDTAIALAAAGFVVAAVTHTGDNYGDRSYAFTLRNFAGRARHIRQVIDYMLDTWPERQRLDQKRIGAFGHSAGGFTVLLAVGGIPTFGRAVQFCAQHPEAWECRQMGQVQYDRPPSNNVTSFASAHAVARDRVFHLLVLISSKPTASSPRWLPDRHLGLFSAKICKG